MAVEHKGLVFQELTAGLLKYKESTPEGRKKILNDTIALIDDMPDIKDSEGEASTLIEIMAAASQLIKYAENLRKIENQAPLPIMYDYAPMGDFLTKNEAFKELLNYVEINGKASTFRWKKPITDVTPAIKTLLVKAQVEYIKSIGKENTFHPEQLDMENQPEDQLYNMPLFMGELNNMAVDRVCMSKKGIFTVTKNADGSYQAPGGGMMHPSEDKNETTYLRQMLSEHLEEEHGSLYITAAKQYNEIDADIFLATLTASVDHKIKVRGKEELHFKALLDIAGFKDKFTKTLEEVKAKPNADRLAAIVTLLDAYKPTGNKSTHGAQKKAIAELRANVQVETFKLHDLFAEAYQFIIDNSVTVDIRQVNDTRSGGGKQISRTFLMNSALEDFFAGHGIAELKLADDLTGGKYVHLDMFEIIATFENFKFSHVLTFTAALKECLENGADFKTMYNQNHFEQAKKAIHDGGMKVLLNNEIHGLASVIKGQPDNHAFKPLLVEFHTEIRSLTKAGKGNAEELKVLVEKALAVIKDPKLAKDFQKHVEGIEHGKASPKMLLVCKILLGIAALAIVLGATAAITPVVATVAAVAAAAGSYGFFAKGKQQGLSLAASKLAAEASKQDVPPAAPAGAAGAVAAPAAEQCGC